MTPFVKPDGRSPKLPGAKGLAIIQTLARVAFTEALRDRILNVAAVFAAAMIAGSLFLADLSVGQDLKLLQDFGLGIINLLVVMLAVFMGSRLISRDLETRTLYTVLSKPVTRAQYLVGKFLGASVALWALLALLAVVYLALVLFTSHGFPLLHLGALGLFGLEAMVLLGMAMLFASVTSPLLSILYTLGLYVIGHNTGLIRSFWEQAGGFEAVFAKLVYYGLPNLEVLNIKNQVVYGETLRLGEWAWSLSYGLAVVVALLALATLAFNQRELP